MYSFAPTPIATDGTLVAGASVAVTLTAQDSTHAPVPSAIVYVVFKRATGGGTAVVGSTGLSLKPQAFVTDGSGHIGITYRAPATLPASGKDSVIAQNAASSPTIKAHDDYSFVNVAKYKMGPRPIAATGSLAASATVTVRLTAVNSTGAAVASAVVYLWFAQAAGGGSATVGSIALTGTRRAFTASSVGQIFITYKTPGTVPTSGTDTINAANTPTGGVVLAHDTYTF
jgi:hypothetical protein